MNRRTRETGKSRDERRRETREKERLMMNRTFMPWRVKIDKILGRLRLLPAVSFLSRLVIFGHRKGERRERDPFPF